MIQIIRRFIDNTGVNQENELAIFKEAFNLSRSNPSQIVFVTPTLNNTDIFRRLFPSINEKLFHKGVTIQNLNNIRLKHLNVTQYLKIYSEPHILISTYLDSDQIFELEDKEIANANCVLPWGATRVEKWAKTTGAINLTSGVSLNPYPFPQQLVIDSLNKIMASVNATGFNSTDMKLVKNEIKQLKNNRIELNRDEIEAYLITHTHHYSWTFVKQFRKHSGI